MKRFYRDTIKALNDAGLREASDNIESYVNHLELKNGALTSELSAAATPRAKMYLKSLGYTDREGVAHESSGSIDPRGRA